jgi:YjbE family integral membrane protein
MDNFSLGMALIEIVWVNILLSGDNAMVIALACRALPARRRRTGILLGAGAAVLLRIVFTLAISELLAVPYLRLVGALLLFWVAVKLLVPEDEEETVAEHDSLLRVIRTIVIADAVMSLDNVLAIVAAAHGATWLVIFGLALSVPLVVAGSSLIIKLIDRFPVLVWAGAAFLGWIAGEMLLSDSALDALHLGPVIDTAVTALGATMVVTAGWLLARRARLRTGHAAD